MKRLIRFFRKILLLSLFLVALGGVCFGLELPWNDDIVIEPDIHWIGTTVHFGYRGVSFFPLVDTTFWISAGFETDEVGYYYLPDGTPYTGAEAGFDPTTAPYFWRINFHWAFGLSQGIVWDLERERNFLEAFFHISSYIDKYWQDNPNQLYFQNPETDKEGSFITTFILGMSLDSLDYLFRSGMWRGYYGQVSLVYAPPFLFNSILGRAHYFAANTHVFGFLPVFGIVNDAGNHIIGGYFGGMLMLDIYAGQYVPAVIRQTAGALRRSVSMGSMVRGVDKGRFDAPFKTSLNLDFRLNLPAIIWQGLIPGFLVYFDSGYYDYFGDRGRGLLFTTGAGVFLRIFTLGEFVVYTQYYINGENINGRSFTPISFELGLHF
ncbi:MAG: hypothetical protein ACLFRY_06465 [Spirochaetia bacterium]